MPPWAWYPIDYEEDSQKKVVFDSSETIWRFGGWGDPPPSGGADAEPPNSRSPFSHTIGVGDSTVFMLSTQKMSHFLSGNLGLVLELEPEPKERKKFSWNCSQN